MTTAKRLDVKESEDLVALEEFEGRDIACLSSRLARCTRKKITPRMDICVDTKLN